MHVLASYIAFGSQLNWVRALRSSTPPMATIKDQLIRRLGSARVLLDDAQGDRRHASISLLQKNAVLELMVDAVASKALQSVEIADITDRVLSVRWSCGHEEELLQFLSSKTVATKRRKQQDFSHITAYFDEDRWDRYQGSMRDLHSKSDILINLAIEMECFNPTEPCVKRWTSDTLVAHYSKKDCDSMEATTKYALMEYIRSTHKRMARPSLDRPTTTYLIKLPADPSELHQQHPAWYQRLFPAGSEPVGPVGKMLDQARAMRMDSSFQCRGGAGHSSKKKVAACAPVVATPTGDPIAQFANFMPIIMQGIAQIINGGGDPRDRQPPGLSGLTYNTGARRSFKALDDDERNLELERFRGGMSGRYPSLRSEEDSMPGSASAPDALASDSLRRKRSDASMADAAASEHADEPGANAAPVVSPGRDGSPAAEDGTEVSDGGVVANAKQTRGDHLLDAIIARDAATKKAAAEAAAAKRVELKNAKAAEAAAAKSEKEEAKAAAAIAAQAEKADRLPTEVAPSAHKLKAGTAPAPAKRSAVAGSPVIKHQKGKRPRLPLDDVDETPAAKRATKPSVSHEKSRTQFLGRSGFTGPNPGNRKFRYAGAGADYNTEAAAKKAAMAWLVDQRKHNASEANDD